MANAAAASAKPIVAELASRRITPGQALLGIALLVGLVLRMAPGMLTNFPLGDGGLFATMARDIREAGFVLPAFSSFNAGDIPFAYPPVGLYLLAAIPGDPIATERWLPIVFSVAAIPFAYLLARQLTGERQAGVAAIIFAAMPATWAIEGGGVTRALGLLLMLAALWRWARTLSSPTFVNALVTGAIAGLALMSHPGVGPTGAISGVVLLAFRPSRRGIVAAAEAAAMSLAVIAPWIAIVVQRYGLGAMQAASQAHHTEEALGRLLTVGPSWSGALDPVFPLAVVGLVVAIHRRDWLLPAWIAAAILVPGGEGRYATIMWAMLAASGVLTVATSLEQVGALRIAARVGLAWLFLGALLAGYQRFHAVPGPVRTAMQEVGRETPVGTRFAVVVRDPAIEQPVLDWFPTLSNRVSLGTFMGLEWTSVAQWDQRVALQRSIRYGEIPPDADAIFIVEGGSASWQLLP